MRKLFWLVLLVPMFANAQMQEDFEDGDLEGWEESVISRWEASAIEPVTGNYSLHHVYNNPSAGHDQISFPNANIVLDAGLTTWKFNIRHGYPPSGANNWGIFLVADQNADQMYPYGEANGYVIGVNYSGSDDHIQLWKISSGSGISLLNTGFSWEDHIDISEIVGFQVTRDEFGGWEIRIDTTGGFDDLITLGTATDTEWTAFNHFGIYYEYSPLQDMKLWIDDITINGSEINDTVPPVIVGVNILSSVALEVEFSEPMEKVPAQTLSNYSVDNAIGYPDSASLVAPEKVILYFQQGFSDGMINNLTVQNVEDLAGNTITLSEVEFMYYLIKQFDIVLNEIMADPEPPVGLPAFEYIELYNTTSFNLSLEGWSVRIGTKKITMDNITFPGDDYLILCSPDATAELNGYGNTLGLAGLSPVANTGQTITVRNNMDQVISSVTYSDEWYQNDLKSEGGWALEQIDPANPCGRGDNWIASEDLKGGTPGQRNSVMDDNPDLESPVLLNTFLLSDTSLYLFFNETYDTSIAMDQENYFVDNDIGVPESVILLTPDYQALILVFESLFIRDETYFITVGDQFTDCAGNPVGEINSRRFGFPELPDSLDVIINEVLFNPFGDGVDYVELYNRSDKILDFNEIRIGSRDDTSGELKSLFPVTDYPYLFFPSEYFVITTGIDKVLLQYFTSNPWGFIELGKMASYPDDEGRVVITDRWFRSIDEFNYHEDMHFPLLHFREGVSLERINMNRLTQDRSNWHSAAESAGFGTPAFENSQFREDPLTAGEIEIVPEIFSPDNDGYNDVVTIEFNFNDPGNVVTITVFDARGRPVRKLVKNELTGLKGIFSWDGRSDSNRIPGIGIYLFYIEVMDMKGNIRAYKKTCVLAGKLN